MAGKGEGIKPPLAVVWGGRALKFVGETVVFAASEFKVGTTIFLAAVGLSAIAWLRNYQESVESIPLKDALLVGATLGWFGGTLAEIGARAIGWYVEKEKEYQRGEITAGLKPIRRRKN